MYKVRITISVFQGWPRKIPGSYTLVAGFLIFQYTVQYTSCILRETGGILAGLWKVCIRNFTRGVGGMCTDFVYLVKKNEPWFFSWNEICLRDSWWQGF